MKLSKTLVLTALLGGALGLSVPVQAQTTARFSTMELKDATLADALEMVFRAANNPAHSIDPAANDVRVGSITLTNIAWDSALRTLANQNGFKVSRGADGIWLVEPREPVLAPGEGDGSSPFGFGRTPDGGFPGNVPSNPFGSSAFGGRRFQSNQLVVPSVSTQSNAQTTPRFGGFGGGNTPGSTAEYQVIIVRHIYVGGIAQVFGGGGTIATLPFVSPGSSGGGFGGGNGGNGGFGGNNGGFGGNNGGSSGFGVSGFGGGSNSSFGGGGGNSFGGSSFGGSGLGGTTDTSTGNAGFGF